MEFCITILFYAAVAWISSYLILTTIKRSKLNPKRPPPGPFPLPIIGNMFALGTHPHKTLTELSKYYGPVMSLQLGYQTTVVISSVSMAKEVLQSNDVAFANRNVPDSLTACNHDKFSVALRPANAAWRNLRKICITQVFANSKLDATKHLRKKNVEALLSYVQTCCDTGKALDIGQVIFTTSLNFLSNTFFSIDLGDPSSTTSHELKELIMDLNLAAAEPNLSDFFPLLKMVDPQGVKKRTTVVIEKIMKLFDTMISERLEERKSSNDHDNKNDVLDALLTLAETSNDFQQRDVRHLLLDLFVAGTDTTSSGAEWAMSELIRNPEKMNKAQTELQQVIGKENIMEEEDATRLPYLQAVVKESMRLHMPVPFLIPRKVFEDTPLGGFTIPKNSQVWVNAYAIGKDPTIWQNPESFEPERFIGSSIEFKGQNFELLAFGSGRRICPGLPLANRMLHWVLGSLIHSFDWKLVDGVTPENLNMEDKLGIILHRAQSLYAIPPAAPPRCRTRFGEVLATTEHRETTIISEIDYSEIEVRRSNLPLGEQRRGDIYQLVDVHRLDSH